MKRVLLVILIILTVVTVAYASPDDVSLSPESGEPEQSPADPGASPAIDTDGVLDGVIAAVEAKISGALGFRGQFRVTVTGEQGQLTISGALAALTPDHYRLIYTSPPLMLGGKVYWHWPLAASVKPSDRYPGVSTDEPFPNQLALELLMHPEPWFEGEVIDQFQARKVAPGSIGLDFQSEELGLAGELVVDQQTSLPRQIKLEFLLGGFTLELTDIRYVVVSSDSITYGPLEEFHAAYQMSMEYLKAGKYREAVPYLETMVRIDPYNVPAHANLGFCYAGLGEDAAAVAEFEQILMLEPESSLALNNLAYLYVDSDLYIEKGLEMAERAVELEPENGSYLDTLGWAYYKSGNYRRAAMTLEKALPLVQGLDASKADVHYHLGVVYWQLGKEDAALTHFKEALALNPDNEQVIIELQRLGAYKDILPKTE